MRTPGKVERAVMRACAALGLSVKRTPIVFHPIDRMNHDDVELVRKIVEEHEEVEKQRIAIIASHGSALLDCLKFTPVDDMFSVTRKHKLPKWRSADKENNE